jgi:hypothetical protein
MSAFLFPKKGGMDVDKFIDWFTGTIRGFHLWEIQLASATMDDMKLWMAFFNVTLIALVATVLILSHKSTPLAVGVILSVFMATIITVSLIR